MREITNRKLKYTFRKKDSELFHKGQAAPEVLGGVKHQESTSTIEMVYASQEAVGKSYRWCHVLVVD